MSWYYHFTFKKFCDHHFQAFSMKERAPYSQIPIDSNLDKYIKKQKRLIKLEYWLETKEKQKTKIPNIDLYFICRNRFSLKEKKIWTTTLPLPKNLIPPEYLIIADPTYVNISDKMIVNFIDGSKRPIEGEVIKIREGELTASFKLSWKGDSARNKCSIQFLPNDIVYQRKLNALTKLKFLNNNLINMLCRIYPKKQIIANIKLNLPRNYDFNDSQKKAIQMAVSNPFSLIQGPPGTGKTHTIGAIAVQALTMEPKKKVLVCGTTNVSINSLLEIVGDMLQQSGFKVCWPASAYRDFKSEENISKEQKLMTLYIIRHMNCKESRRFQKLSDKRNRTDNEDIEMNILRDKLEQKVIQQSNVIFSTLDSSGKKSIVKNIGSISTLIVDEATLSVESSMIIPLSLLPDRFVLVGDHKQLGPQPSFKELKNEGYYYSMFERIIKERSCLRNSVMLNTQYRMHPDISYLPNTLFYDNELINGVRPEDRMISRKFAIQKHINFININGVEEKNGTSYFNQEEIDYVVKFVNSLIDSGVHSSQIGVISAYGAQTHYISEKFKNDGIRVKVSTIDSFQGSQKDYIIICTTRNGSNIGFLTDKRRMNVAITRARCMVAIFGNEQTLSQSSSWNEVIKHTKEKSSFYLKLPIRIEKSKYKPLVISKNSNNITREMVSEFKENESEAGYNLSEIHSEISDSNVRILWPDEKDDVVYLNDWVQKRVEILKKRNNNVTLAYDAESVCMQFGDIFHKDVDYYNYNCSDIIPEIKVNESIIISFYKHKGNHDFDPILVQIMKPLLEDPKITLITFDFTFDFDKLYDFGIDIKTTRVIDVQLMVLPEDELNDDCSDDFIRSTGWKPIREFILQAMDNNINDRIIDNAKDSIKKDKKKFPHEENSFLIELNNYPQISQFTKIFLDYSAGDIFYTAVCGIDVLSRGNLEIVKKRSLMKLASFKDYRRKYGNVRCVRDGYYVRESFTSVIQAQFSKESQTYEILGFYKKLKTYITLIEKYPELLHEIIPEFNEEDVSNFKEKYNYVLNNLKDPENDHLGNIKDKAILALVDGIKKSPGFVSRVKEVIEEDNESIQEIEVAQEKVEPKVESVQVTKTKKKSKKKKKNRFIYTPGEDS